MLVMAHQRLHVVMHLPCVCGPTSCRVQQLCRRFPIAGSRSSPLALAAAQHPRAQVTCCIDERSLAFWALGYGRATGCDQNLDPTPRSCHKGTALHRQAGLRVCVSCQARASIGMRAVR